MSRGFPRRFIIGAHSLQNRNGQDARTTNGRGRHEIHGVRVFWVVSHERKLFEIPWRLEQFIRFRWKHVARPVSPSVFLTPTHDRFPPFPSLTENDLALAVSIPIVPLFRLQTPSLFFFPSKRQGESYPDACRDVLQKVTGALQCLSRSSSRSVPGRDRYKSVSVYVVKQSCRSRKKGTHDE